MILGNPWGLLGLLAVPAIIAIHLYRRRYRPRPVTALWLYGPQQRTIAAGRVRQRLVWRASLLLELLAALAATWWLADLHLGAREVADHLVLVLDDRASLQARGADGVSSLERLRDEARQKLRGLARDDRATVVLSGQPPRLIAGPAARPREIEPVLERWTADAPWHALDEAVALGAGVGGSGARVVVLTDRPERLPAGIGRVSRGRALATAGLADVRWHRDGQGERIVARALLQGGAPGQAPQRRTLALLAADGRSLASVALDLEPGKPAAASLTPPAGTVGERLELALLGEDPLARDDRVALLRPPRRAVSVQLRLPEPAAAPFRRALEATGEATFVADGAAANLRIAAAGADEPPIGTWQLALAPGGAKPVLGPFLARSGHPVLADCAFAGLLWAGGLDGAPTDSEVLLAAGEAALLTERRRGRDRLLALHVDLPQSGLLRHPAWPALVANLVAARRAALPGPERANLPLGVPLAITLPPGARALAVTDPAGGRSELQADAAGVALLPGLRAAGVHRLDPIGDGLAAGGEPWAWINALPIDPRLADLGVCADGEQAPDAAARGDVERRRGLVAHLVPLVLAALTALGAWFAFPREEGRS